MATTNRENIDIAVSPSSGPSRHRKRNSVSLSCAECRRLKLRCSRVFPCSNCAKKGCAAICPDGSLTTGKGNRFVLANTEVLHDKILQLSNRVRNLEDALAETYALLSAGRHPLLSEDLLSIKQPLEREQQRDPPPMSEEDQTLSENNENLDALGSLAISQDGRSSFFGTTANSWYLLQNERGTDDDDDVRTSLSPEIPWISQAFPMPPAVGDSADEGRAAILCHLPDSSVAQRISQIYFQHAGWMYSPIPESEFYQTVFRRIYDPQWISSDDDIDMHCIAVLYMVLALGTLMDLNLPPHSEEATRWYSLGRTALALNSILEEQSIAAIQALLLMCHYMFLDGIEGRWVLMGVVVKLAHSVGLHRDSGKWNLGPEEAQKRRSLLWEIYTYDSWQSLTFGRPPSFALAHIDCPQAHPTTKDELGQVEMSYAAWKHRFCSQCLSIVHDRAFGAHTPSYKTIKELDKKVRDFYLPPSLQVPGFGGAKMKAEVERPSLELTMQRYTAYSMKEITIFYMHRGFFARAVGDHPDDPLSSAYAPSVLAAYGSACSFIGLIESLFAQHPRLTERMSFFFAHVFSCSIVLGSIAVKARMALAPSAFSHLQSAYNLFSQASGNQQAAKVLPILAKLRERARTAFSENSARTPPALLLREPSRVKEDADELSALGGTTRLVARPSRRRLSSSQYNVPRSTGELYSSSSPSSSVSSPPSQHASTPPPFIDFSSPTVEHASLSWPGFDLTQVQDFSGIPSPLAMIQETYQTVEDTPLTFDTHQYPNSQISMALDTVQDNYPGYQDTHFANTVLSQAVSASRSPADTAEDPNWAWQNFMAQFKNI